MRFEYWLVTISLPNGGQENVVVPVRGRATLEAIAIELRVTFYGLGYTTTYLGQEILSDL